MHLLLASSEPHRRGSPRDNARAWNRADQLVGASDTEATKPPRAPPLAPPSPYFSLFPLSRCSALSLFYFLAGKRPWPPCPRAPPSSSSCLRGEPRLPLIVAAAPPAPDPARSVRHRRRCPFPSSPPRLQLASAAIRSSILAQLPLFPGGRRQSLWLNSKLHETAPGLVETLYTSLVGQVARWQPGGLGSNPRCPYFPFVFCYWISKPHLFHFQICSVSDK